MTGTDPAATPPAEPRRPDAIIFPAGTFRGDLNDRAVAIKRRFAPVFGTSHAHGGKVGGQCFSVPTNNPYAVPDFAVTQPAGHPEHGAPRYAWFVAIPTGPASFDIGESVRSYDERPDQILLGYRLPDNHEDDAKVRADILAERERRAADARARLAAMTPEERADREEMMRRVGIVGMPADRDQMRKEDVTT